MPVSRSNVENRRPVPGNDPDQIRRASRLEFSRTIFLQVDQVETSQSFADQEFCAALSREPAT